MRRRMVMVGTLVAVLVVMMLPATAAAATYQYRVVANYCFGGSNVYIKVKMIKPSGWFTVDRFTIDAQGQHRNIGGSRWSNEGSSTRFTKWVPDTSNRFVWTQAIEWRPSNYAWHRIKLTLRVWWGSRVQARQVVTSVSC